MKIITMRRAAEILNDTTANTGKDFAKKHQLTTLDTDARHGRGKAIFFDEAEVIAKAQEAYEKRKASQPESTGHPSQLAHRKIRTVARALIDLYKLLGELPPDALHKVAEHDR